MITILEAISRLNKDANEARESCKQTILDSIAKEGIDNYNRTYRLAELDYRTFLIEKYGPAKGHAKFLKEIEKTDNFRMSLGIAGLKKSF